MKKAKGPPIVSIFIIAISLAVFLFTVFSRDKVQPVVEVENVTLEGETSKVLGGSVAVPQEEEVPSISEAITEALEEKPIKEVPNNITALSYIVYDAVEDDIVVEKNPNLILPPASTTKIMTALVALEEYSLGQFLNVPRECIDLPGSNAYLRFSDKLTVESLLYALLLPSASDAACVLARGNNNPYAFLAKMNEKANNLGLEHTNFENVIGLDSDDDNHFSTAKDLLIMAKEAMNNREFMKIVGTKRYLIPSYSSDQTYEVRNTNELLFSVPGTVGIKTGYTDKARGCLIYAYENRGKEVIIIVMGSAEGSRFTDTKALLDWYLEL